MEQRHLCGDHTLFVSKVLATTVNEEVIIRGNLSLLKDSCGSRNESQYSPNFPVPINLTAYLSGRIAKIVPEHGVEVETLASFYSRNL